MRIFTIFSRRQQSIGSAAAILASMVFASRVLGLIRDRLLSMHFKPDELGIYFAAFRLPNIVFELLVIGALTTAFIPVYTRYITRKDERSAQIMASTIINLSLFVLFVLLIPMLIWAERISVFFAPGFSPVQVKEMATFTRLILVLQVGPLLIGNFFTGILQSYSLFLVPAIAPVMYNIGIILAIVFLAGTYGLYAPILGVGIGALFFMLIQLPLLLHVGYRHALTVNPKNKGVREVIVLMLPRTFGLAISQIDTTVDLMLATLLGARMVTIFSFAQHLQQLPVGLFGATVAQAAFPSLSASSSVSDLKTFKSSIISALHQILFFVLPVSVLFIILRIPIVRLVFGSWRFDWEATVLTGMTLSYFSISLFAQSIVHLFARSYYALYDSKTPVAVGAASIAVNTLLSVVFIVAYRLPVWSLGLSTSVSSILHAVFLFLLLDRKVGRFPRIDLLVPVIKMGTSAFFTGIMLYIPLKLLDQLVFDTTRTINLLILTGITMTIGLSTYLFLCWVFGVSEVRSFFVLLGKVRRARAIFFEPAREVVNGGGQDNL